MSWNGGCIPFPSPDEHLNLLEDNMTDNGNYKYLNEKLLGFTEWVIDHPVLVLIFCFLLGAGSIVLSSNLHIDNSIEAYFNPDDPSYVEI